MQNKNIQLEAVQKELVQSKDAFKEIEVKIQKEIGKKAEIEDKKVLGDQSVMEKLTVAEVEI